MESNKNEPFSYIRMSKFRMQLFSNGEHASYFRRSFLEDSDKYSRMMDSKYIIGSSSKGLVCFYCKWDRRFTIWNPATGEFRCISGHVGRLVGYDVRPCGDFRLVVISCGFIGDIVIEMHRRSSKRWKKISKGNVPEKALFPDSSKVVTLGGCMYWRTWLHDVQGKWYQDVACFDMWKFEYRTISGPAWIRQTGKLGVVNGLSLGLFFSGEVDDTITVWVMNGEDGSWTKRYSVVPFRRERFKSMRGEEVDIVILDGVLHFYHYPTKKFWSFTNLSEHLDVVQYKESLFSVYKPKV